MTRTQTRAVPAPLARVRSHLGLIGGAAVAIAAFLLVVPMVAVPPVVSAVAVSNPNVYFVNVEVRGTDRNAWLDLGTVGREQTETFQEVFDQGSEWTFRFSYAGLDVSELAVGRTQLARQGWKLSVPGEVTDRLREAGLPPSANS